MTIRARHEAQPQLHKKTRMATERKCQVSKNDQPAIEKAGKVNISHEQDRDKQRDQQVKKTG